MNFSKGLDNSRVKLSNEAVSVRIVAFLFIKSIVTNSVKKDFNRNSNPESFSSVAADQLSIVSLLFAVAVNEFIYAEIEPFFVWKRIV